MRHLLSVFGATIALLGAASEAVAQDGTLDDWDLLIRRHWDPTVAVGDRQDRVRNVWEGEDYIMTWCPESSTGPNDGGLLWVYLGGAYDGPLVEEELRFIELARASGDIVFDVPNTGSGAPRPVSTWVFAAGATEAEVTSKKVEIDPKTGKEKVLEEKKDTMKTDTGVPTGAEHGSVDSKKPAAATPKPAPAPKPAEKK